MRARSLSSVEPQLQDTPSAAPLNLEVLRDYASTVYVLANDLRIIFVNPAWSRFAAENGAQWRDDEWGPGRPVLDAVPPVLRPFYRRLYESARDWQEVVEHNYECSSESVRRMFRMRILPSANDLVVVHSLVRESPHPAVAAPAFDALYRDERGIILQCSHCRRVRAVADASKWEWVPSYVAQMPPGTSHGLCTLCYAYYYPDLISDNAP